MIVDYILLSHLCLQLYTADW